MAHATAGQKAPMKGETDAGISGTPRYDRYENSQNVVAVSGQNLTNVVHKNAL